MSLVDATYRSQVSNLQPLIFVACDTAVARGPLSQLAPDARKSASGKRVPTMPPPRSPVSDCHVIVKSSKGRANRLSGSQVVIGTGDV